MLRLSCDCWSACLLELAVVENKTLISDLFVCCGLFVVVVVFLWGFFVFFVFVPSGHFQELCTSPKGVPSTPTY